MRLAEQEAGREVRATYFLLAGTSYYNLLGPEHAHVARELVAMGHEVGLHYDVRSFLLFPRREWPRLLRAQATLLGGCPAVPSPPSPCTSRRCMATIRSAERITAF